jgi:hypothetical protein
VSFVKAWHLVLNFCAMFADGTSLAPAFPVIHADTHQAAVLILRDALQEAADAKAAVAQAKADANAEIIGAASSAAMTASAANALAARHSHRVEPPSSSSTTTTTTSTIPLASAPNEIADSPRLLDKVVANALASSGLFGTSTSASVHPPSSSSALPETVQQRATRGISRTTADPSPAEPLRLAPTVATATVASTAMKMISGGNPGVLGSVSGSGVQPKPVPDLGDEPTAPPPARKQPKRGAAASRQPFASTVAPPVTNEAVLATPAKPKDKNHSALPATPAPQTPICEPATPATSAATCDSVRRSTRTAKKSEKKILYDEQLTRKKK